MITAYFSFRAPVTAKTARAMDRKLESIMGGGTFYKRMGHFTVGHNEIELCAYADPDWVKDGNPHLAIEPKSEYWQRHVTDRIFQQAAIRFWFHRNEHPLSKELIEAMDEELMFYLRKE